MPRWTQTATPGGVAGFATGEFAQERDPFLTPLAAQLEREHEQTTVMGGTRVVSMAICAPWWWSLTQPWQIFFQPSTILGRTNLQYEFVMQHETCTATPFLDYATPTPRASQNK